MMLWFELFELTNYELSFQQSTYGCGNLRIQVILIQLQIDFKINSQNSIRHPCLKQTEDREQERIRQNEEQKWIAIQEKNKTEREQERQDAEDTRERIENEQQLEKERNRKQEKELNDEIERQKEKMNSEIEKLRIRSLFNNAKFFILQ